MTPIEPFPVGPLRVLAPLERTGEAEVWRALHVDSSTPVALKVFLRGPDDDQALAMRRLARLQGVVALDHPSLGRVLGVGRVATEAAARSRGRLREGSLWVATELVSGGSVLEHPPARFDDLRHALAGMLGALAHAHARGVLHLALKPTNVLVAGRRDPRPGLKLVDLLLERSVVDATVRTDAGSGAVAYLAPEQLEARTEAIGPWTDLYAVGCLGWALATGAPPFVRDTAVATARAVLGGVRPAFVPRVVCPDAFVDWLGALLASDPSQRPRHAADALQALLDLEEPSLFDDDEEDELTATMGDPFVSPEEPTHHGFDEAMLAAGAPGTPPLERMAAPRSVGPWQVARLPAPALDAAGMALWGLRDAPLAGRDVPQQSLWDTLRWVHGAQRARSVVLRGAEGSGRTALARWFAHRAAELGVASVWWVRDEPRALARSVWRWLGVGDRPASEQEAALAQRLDAATVRSVQALVAGRLQASERAGVVRRLLQAATEVRPVVFVVDDAERQLELLQLVGDLESLALPVVCLVGVGEAGSREVGTSLLLERLEGPTLELGALSEPEARRWLVEAAGLAPSLAAVATGRGGAPLYLQQLVSRWALAGLKRTGEGLVTVGEAPTLPIGLEELWLVRVDDVLEAMEPAAGWDLHVAATLGRQVALKVWHTACDDPEGEGHGWDPAGVQRREALVEALWLAGLARIEGDGFGFVHPTLHRALVAQAQAMGRTQWLHHACAHALVLHDVGDGARLGTHLLRAGEPEGAVGPLLQAAVDLARRRPTDALEVLAVAEEAAHEAALPPTSLASVALLVTRAEVHLAARERPEALRWASWAERAVEHHGAEAAPEHQRAWQEHLARALRVAFDAFMEQDEPVRASRVLDKLEPVVRGLGEPVAIGQMLMARARWCRSTGQDQQAAPLLAEAMASFTGSAVEQARVRLDWAGLALHMGLLADAERTLDEALAQADALEGERLLWGRLLALRGELALHSGHDGAAAWLEEGAAVRSSMGRDPSRARLLGAVARGADDPLPAVTVAREAAERVRPRARLAPLAALALAIAEARVRRWPAVHDAVARFEVRPPDAHPTIAWLAGVLAEECDDAGFPQLGERVRARPVG